MIIKLQYYIHVLLTSKYRLFINLFIIFSIYFIIQSTNFIYCMNDNINIDERPLQNLVQQMRFNEDRWWQNIAGILDRRPIPVEGRPQFVLLLRSDVILMTQQLNPELYRQTLEPYIETMITKKALLNQEFLQLQAKNQLLSNQIELNTFSNFKNIKSIEDKVFELNNNMDSQFDRINRCLQKLENKLDNLDNTMKQLKK